MTNLPRNGVEYFSWALTGLPDDHGPVEVNIDGAWHALTVAGSIGKLLLAGPDADPTGAVVVPTDQQVQVRVTDTPEVIIRGGGRIHLTTE